MIGYRIVSEREIKEILNQESLLRNKQHGSYNPGEVIFFIQGDDYENIFNRYSNSIACLRSLNENDSLYLLKLTNLEEEQIEMDQSQNRWENSRVYLDDININNISVMGFGETINSNEGLYKVLNFEEYSNEIPINEVLNNKR